MSLESFIAAYIECALWSSTDNADDSGGEPLDRHHGPEDIAPEALATMHADCKSFYDDNWAAWAPGELWSDDQAGHDFWLTRNRHGAGFWDRYSAGMSGAAGVGRRLTDAAHAYGEANLYIGDDSKIYHD